jgi:hypothetical protein
MYEQTPDRGMLQGCDNRQHDPDQESRAEANEVMENEVDDARTDARPEAHARQTSGLSKVGVEGRKVDTFWLW